MQQVQAVGFCQLFERIPALLKCLMIVSTKLLVGRVECHDASRKADPVVPGFRQFALELVKDMD